MGGYVNLLRDKPTEEEFLARLAYLKGITGRVQPMRPILLVVLLVAFVLTGRAMVNAELDHAEMKRLRDRGQWRSRSPCDT
jgi:hypothetical protein